MTDGRPSDDQVMAQTYLRGMGYPVETIRSLEEFQAVIRAYLSSIGF